ncbi:MAG: hypothetical protein OES57_09545 [Acidimicrobiia bacterium]|nr:hypothetical protein [Acidimicrobiia bacterium]
MVEFDADTIRIFLHLLGASVWIGGQIVLAALVPVLRTLGPDAPRAAANRFGRVAWPFFALVVATGIWNMLTLDYDVLETSYHMTLGIKMLLVAASGIAAFVHSNTSNVALRGVTGGGGLVAGLAAMVLGVMLVI